LTAFAVMLALALSSALAYGQVSTHLRLSEYQKTEWQVEDGLPENYVRMIAQRPDGQLLLATSFGLATFDGVRFQEVAVAGLSSGETVNAILYGRDGALWVGTDGHGVIHTTDTGAINISEVAGRMNERVRALYEDAQSALWIATQNGVERYKDGRLEVFAEAGMISARTKAALAQARKRGVKLGGRRRKVIGVDTLARRSTAKW